LLYSIGHHPTILDKKVILKLGLKEFFVSYIKQCTIYSSTLQDENLLEENNGRDKYWNWPSKNYWSKFVQKINKHTMQFPYKKDSKHFEHPIHDKINIYHKYLFNFFPRYLDTHFGNTLFVMNMFYKTC